MTPTPPLSWKEVVMNKTTGLQTVGIDEEGCPQARLTVNRCRAASWCVRDSPCGPRGPLLSWPSCRAGGRALGSELAAARRRMDGKTRETYRQGNGSESCSRSACRTPTWHPGRLHRRRRRCPWCCSQCPVEPVYIGSQRGRTRWRGRRAQEGIPDRSVLPEQVEQLLGSYVVAGSH